MSKPKNILLIWTDEQRADTMAAYGNNHIEMPNLNRFASESFVFDNAYCCQPVCTPSRGCIMTGLWPHQHGAATNNQPLRPEVRTLAEHLGDAYQRVYMGKWHLGDEIIAQHGWEKFVGIEEEYRAYYSDPAYLEQFSPYYHFLKSHGFPPTANAKDGQKYYPRNFAAALPYRFTKAGFLAQQASAYLADVDRSRPFCLSVNFLEPHMPFFGPYNDRYDPDALPVGPAFGKAPDASASLRNRAISEMYRREGHNHMPLRTEADLRRMRANYYGLCTMIDRAVGSILNTLQAAGLADDTLVIFTSDHGEMMGDHHQLAKGVMYQEAVRIPLLMRAPWLSKQQTHLPGHVSQIDLLPTILDLSGNEVPSGLAGTSRQDVVTGSATLAENDVFFIWHGDEYKVGHIDLPGATPEQLAAVGHQDWHCVVSHEGWKLNLCETDPSNELYDLNSDPHELVNRYRDPECAGIVRDLTARIAAWRARSGT